MDKKTESKKDPILSYPTQAQTHDELRQLRRRGFIAHKNGDGQRKVRDGQIRGKAAVKAAKRERQSLREIRRELAESRL